MSNNIMLGWPNHVDLATFSGGTWRADPFGLANIGLHEITKVAWSDDITTASTQFQVDFSSAKRVRVISEINHTAPEDALRRIKAGTTAGASDLYLGDWENFHGIAYSESGIEFRSGGWWGNGPTSPASFVYGNPFIGVYVLPADVTARYWSIEYDVTGSAYDHFQIGRLFMGPVYQPEFNAVYGLVEGMVDYSQIQKLPNGGIVIAEARSGRTVQFEFPLTRAGAEEYCIREMLRMQRTIGDILYVPYPGDPEKRQIKGFLGRLEELSGMNTIGYMRRSIGLKLIEKV